MLKGIPASRGIGIGRAVVYKEAENSNEFLGKKVTETEVEKEIQRFKSAVDFTKIEFESVKGKASNVLEEKDLQLFEAYKMVLNDPIFDDMVLKNIKEKLLCSEASVLDAVNNIKAMFLSLSNDYMKQRAEDIENVGKYILDALTGRKRIDLNNFSEDTILIAKDLTPADTVSLDKKHIKGFAIQKGGTTSHTAIVARTLEIPAVVGCGEGIMEITSGDMLILDGENGLVLLNPDEDIILEYTEKLRLFTLKSEEIKELKEKDAETIDGVRVELVGNIAKPEEALVVMEKGGNGVGLFRTEFLYLDRVQLPTEDEQFQTYKRAAESLGGRECIIRTMDIGGDKQMKSLSLPAEENPFLGYRAIRICLKETEMFKAQLRAILRAGVYGNLKVMFPMISGLEELRAVKKLMDEVKDEMLQKGIPFDEGMKVGIMIEIPSAAVISDLLAREVDFFSIGTNDLSQYTLAVDRMNEKISYLYNPLHLGVLRLIKNIIDSGHQAGIQVGMCGEMAANAECAVILLGLGLDEFSMVPSSIPHIKKIFRSLTFEKAKDIAEKVIKMENAKQIAEYVKERIYVD